MTVQPRSKEFKENAKSALKNETMQRALNDGPSFIQRRADARALVPEFDDIRDAARDLKDHTLAHLDLYLERYEAAATAAGAVVHWAETGDEARKIILDICDRVKRGDTAVVNKGKSMISEEIHINEALEEAGHTVVETDLGEYIVQLRGEKPSHILAPAIHVTREQVEADFRAAHTDLPAERVFPDVSSMVREARTVLRRKYFESDVGITGANMLVAETGQSVLVTNEGNGDLTQSLSRVHIVLASLEKVVPTLEDATTVLRLLARSGTGQAMSVYTTFTSGPRRAEDADGPEEYHVILLDNGRSNLIGTEFQDMLRCIRCGACMNHCPVYKSVGGHSYGWVYPGPIGAVVTPALIGVDEARHLPNASTFCGRCEAVCPMRIPLPKMMRHWREKEFERGLTPKAARYGLGFWAFFARRPRLYHLGARLGMGLLRRFAGRRGGFSRLPFASGWTAHRDFPAPEGGTFQAQWAKRGGK